jgi:hypothetical protein
VAKLALVSDSTVCDPEVVVLRSDADDDSDPGLERDGNAAG